LIRILWLGVAWLLVSTTAAAQGDARSFTFHYRTTIGPIEAGAGPLHVWIPLAATSDAQRIVGETIDASIPGGIETEDVYGNRFWHGTLAEPAGQTVEVAVATTVERRVAHHRPPPRSAGLPETKRATFEPFLGSNARVVVNHPILTPIREEVTRAAASDDKATLARAIYDWVVDHVEYKKVGTGWGNGDTFWACNERYGNCTDFHALFISLARSEDIPARFEIGFPIPEDRPAGEIGGYHCWVEFYLPETGWFPIDASEASKHPEKRELFYGSQPADRIHFTTGRDLQLGPDHQSGPLNYFVYPHVEVGGVAWQGRVEREFSYRDQ
jgi:hypothetical protein